MKIVLVGQKAFGASVLEAYVKNGFDIAGIVVGTKDLEKEDQVETVAKTYGLDCIKVDSLKTESVFNWIKNKKPDLIAMAFVTLFMPNTIVKLAPLGTINFHPSLLPLHRGISALPWTILSGDKIAGLSVYYVDDGMDTGDIIIQKETPVNDLDFKTLYFENIFPLGVDAMVEAINKISNKTAPRIKQDDSKATYEPPLRREHLLIDWDDSTEMILRKIRAGNPGIGGVSMFGEREVRIFTAEKQENNQNAKNGEIISVKNGIEVKTSDGSILIDSICSLGEKKIKSVEYAKLNNIKIGNSFANAK